MFKITAYSMWISLLGCPEEYWVETQDEADELASDLRNQQYSVDVEYIEEG